MNEKRQPKQKVLTAKPKPRLRETTGSTTDSSDDSNTSSGPEFLLSSTKILNDLRKSRIFTDIDLECIGSGICFAAHSVVLASSSGYFRTHFITKFHKIDTTPQVKRSKSLMGGKDAILIRRKISLEITPENLATLLDFMYTGCLTLPLDTNRLRAIITSAQKLKIPKFVSYVVDSLRSRLSITTNTLLWDVAIDLDDRKLREEIVRFLAKRFDQLAESRELICMSFSRLKAVCQYLHINSDSHDEILSAILLWVKHDSKLREKEFPPLLRYIEVSYLSSLYIAMLVKCEPWVRRVDRFWDVLSLTHVERVNRNKKIMEYVSMSVKQANASEQLRVRSSLCNELPLKASLSSSKSTTPRTSSSARVLPKRAATASITSTVRLSSQQTLDDDALSPRSRRFLSKNKRFLYDAMITFDLQSDAMGDAGSGRRSDYKKSGYCN